MNYQQALDYIESYVDYEKVPVPHAAANYDLRRVEELLARLGNPHLGARSVHIAGTKGKGSVAAMIASALIASGYTTGLYTSPHLHTWRERIRVNGQLITEEEFIALVEKLKPEVEVVNRKATYGELTTFELLTALGFAYFKLKDSNRQSLQVKGRLSSYKLSIPLLGQYQLENAAVAVAALEVLAEKGFKISRDNIIRGLAEVNWPGRLQILSRRPLLVVDGAHNPDSARKLKQSLEHYFKLSAKGGLKSKSRPFDRAILIIGVSCDKNIAGIVSELASFFDRVIVTRSRHPRAMAPPPIVAEFARYGVEVQVAEDVPTALVMALNMAGARDLVCVAGSLFVVGEAIEQANKQGHLLTKI